MDNYQQEDDLFGHSICPEHSQTTGVGALPVTPLSHERSYRFAHTSGARHLDSLVDPLSPLRSISEHDMLASAYFFNPSTPTFVPSTSSPYRVHRAFAVGDSQPYPWGPSCYPCQYTAYEASTPAPTLLNSTPNPLSTVYEEARHSSAPSEQSTTRRKYTFTTESSPVSMPARRESDDSVHHQLTPTTIDRRSHVARVNTTQGIHKTILPQAPATPRSMASTAQEPPAKNESGLYYSNFDDAEKAAFNRTQCTVPNDDWADVETRPFQHIQKLLAAFKDDYAEEAEQFALSKTADKSRWIAYQEGHIDRMSKYDDATVEASCWVLLKHLISAHRLGMKTLRYHKVETSIKCSDHVTLIASAIRKYAVIRYDVVRLQRLDELVCCTTSAVSRKIANFRGNWNKTERENENKQKAEACGIEYVPVLGDKRRVARDENESAAVGKAGDKKRKAQALAADHAPGAVSIKPARKLSGT